MIDGIAAADVTLPVARALEALLGHGVTLTIAEPVFGPPNAGVLPEGATRCVALPFTEGVVGEVTLVVGEQFATAMEAATSDGDLTSATVPVLEAAADAIAPIVGARPHLPYAGEIGTDTLLSSIEGDFVCVAILEDEREVACIVIRLLDVSNEAPPAIATPIPAAAYDPPPAAPRPAFADITAAIVPVPASASGVSTPGAIALHEFQPLTAQGNVAGAPRALTLLNDVEMELVAELGRMRMKVRDLMALAPGSVIELDRAAGSPLDLLVNGALLARGEVVVIDEEYGIRVSEIVVGEN